MRLGVALEICDSLENRRAGLVKGDVTTSRNHLTVWQRLSWLFFHILPTTGMWFLEVAHGVLFLSPF
jgi:hypothetical protein